MKHIACIIFALLIASTALCQTPVSVRSQSLAGAIDGQWDLLYDPINLSLVKGLYIYTNLADYNLQWCDEPFNDNNWENETEFTEELPLGVAFTNPFYAPLRHSLLIRLRQSRTTEWMDHNGSYDGEVTIYTTEYIDTDNDGIYDVTTKMQETEKDYGDITKRLFLAWNNSMQMGDAVYGLMFVYDKNSLETDDAMGNYGSGMYGGPFRSFSWGDNSYSSAGSHYNYGESDPFQTWEEVGDFCTEDSYGLMRIQLAAMRPMMLLNEENEVRVDFTFEHENDAAMDTDDNYHARFFRYEQDGLFSRIGNTDESLDSSMEMNTSTFQLGLGLRRTFAEATQRYYEGFWECGVDVAMLTGDIDMDYRRMENSWGEMTNELTGELLESNSVDDVRTLNESGDLSGFETHLHGRVNIPFSQDVYFGLGYIASWEHRYFETDYSERHVRIEEEYSPAYEEGQMQNTRIISMSAYESDQEDSQDAFVLDVPVGLEFRLPVGHISESDNFCLRNFRFRLGTGFHYRSVEQEVVDRFVNFEPEMRVTETTVNGHTDIEVEQIDDQDLESMKTLTKTVTGFKSYHFGVGYVHSDFLEIDAGGYYMADSDDYYLGISFTVKR